MGVEDFDISDYFCEVEKFIGRKEELKKLTELMASNRFATVSGKIGSGKTKTCEYFCEVNTTQGKKYIWCDYEESLENTIISGVDCHKIKDSTYSNKQDLFIDKMNALEGEGDITLVIDDIPLQTNISELKTWKIPMICIFMDSCDSDIKIGPLSEEDAWELFKNSLEDDAPDWIDLYEDQLRYLMIYKTDRLPFTMSLYASMASSGIYDLRGLERNVDMHHYKL